MKPLIYRSIGAYLNALGYIHPNAAGKKGYKLFTTPRTAPLKPHHVEFLHAGRYNQYDIDGTMIQSYKWGEGPHKILLLHGWQSHSFRWKRYIEAFDKQVFTLYALDAPAHGLSGGAYLTAVRYAASIEHFIRQIGRVDVTIGHSLGGFAAMYLYHKYPGELSRALVTMGVPGKALDFVDTIKTILHLNDRTVQLIISTFQKKYHMPFSYFDVTNFAPHLNIPGLIVHDKQDKEAPFSYIPTLHELWPQSDLLITEGQGHSLNGRQVTEKVMDFVRNMTEEPS